MLHFRDKTFCSAQCKNTECHRNITEKVKKEAENWWGGPNPPIATSDFSPSCEYFSPKE